MVKKYRRKTVKPSSAAGVVGKLLARWGARPGRDRLGELWASWRETMGAELAALVRPLGCKGKVLLLGVENAIQMQEAQFAAQEILERANEFLQAPFFEQTHCSIFTGGKSPSPANFAPPKPEKAKKRANFARPSGKYLKQMDKDSPVARCYAAFAGKKLK